MTTIKISNARARKPEWSMAEPVDFTMEEGEHIAIIGRNGSGKSMFVDILTGRHPAFPNMVEYGFDEPYNNLKHITFRDTYGGDNDRTYFLQQRWNQMEIDEETPTVGSKLEEAWLARIHQSVAPCKSISMNCFSWSHCLINTSSSCQAEN